MDDVSAVPVPQNVLDKWIIALLIQLRNEVTSAMDAYRIDKAVRPFAQFVDDLSTWYVRRSRDRYKDESDPADAASARNVTKYVLLECSKLLAPFMPFLAEDVYLRVSKAGDTDSVHLLSWPEYQDDADAAVLAAMEQTRAAVSVGLEVRAKAGVKVRQPLASVTVPKTYDALSDAAYADIAKDELNVKELVVSNTAESVSLDLTITDDLRKEGLARDFIRAIQSARKTAGMIPSDTVTVLACVPSDALWNVLESSLADVRKVTRASSIARTPEAQFAEAAIGGEACTISVERADVSRS
jgi:isoleucyl-tRNA synthetase